MCGLDFQQIAGLHQSQVNKRPGETAPAFRLQAVRPGEVALLEQPFLDEHRAKSLGLLGWGSLHCSHRHVREPSPLRGRS